MDTANTRRMRNLSPDLPKRPRAPKLHRISATLYVWFGFKGPSPTNPDLPQGPSFANYLSLKP